MDKRTPTRVIFHCYNQMIFKFINVSSYWNSYVIFNSISPCRCCFYDTRRSVLAITVRLVNNEFACNEVKLAYLITVAKYQH